MDLTVIDGDNIVLDINEVSNVIELDTTAATVIEVAALSASTVIEVMAGLKGDKGDPGSGTGGVTDYSELTGTPNLATVATSGSYTDLINIPNIPAVPSDIDAATAAQGALADSAVQPEDLATVATTGNYNDLSNKPTIPDSADDIGAVPDTRTVAGKPLNTDITFDKTNVGLDNVDNTSDLDKPISTATQEALDTKVMGTGINAIVSITQTAYDALATKDSTTLYIITE